MVDRAGSRGVASGTDRAGKASCGVNPGEETVWGIWDGAVTVAFVLAGFAGVFAIRFRSAALVVLIMRVPCAVIGPAGEKDASSDRPMLLFLAVTELAVSFAKVALAPPGDPALMIFSN